MRFLAPVTVAAISGVILWKLLATLVLPLLGLMFGLILAAAKLAMIAAVIFFIYSRMRTPRDEASA